jgi:methionine-rich copper-binding protein CopC
MTCALKAAALALLSAFALVLVTAAPALAHTELLSSTPADGSAVGPAPGQIALHFSEALDPRFVRIAVRGPGGAEAAEGRPGVRGSVVTQRIDPRSSGKYTVSYRVVSADGHPVSASLAFTATAGSPQAAATVPAVPTLPTALTKSATSPRPSLAAASANREPSRSPAMFVLFGVMLAVGMGVLVIRSRPQHGGSGT